MSGSDDPGAGFRAEMVAHLTERGGHSDPRVAAALGQVPRHLFVPGVELSEAYADQAIVTRYREGMPTSSASQPGIVAIMLAQLRPPPGGSILEIGAGTGYNAALLSKLVGPGWVVTVDIDPEVADEARNHLSEAGITNVEVICGDGALGWPDGAPYAGIIVTAGASDLAPAWADQLAAQGRLVVPLSIRGVQQCVAFTRANDHLHSVAVCDCGFMPLTGVMAATDRREPVPGHPDVYVQAAADTEVDIGLVRDALDEPGPATHTGITASALEVLGSLRRWLAFQDRASASLAYTGAPEGADASSVPPVLDFQYAGRAQRSSPCILGPTGFAALDRAAPVTPVGDFGLHTMLDLAVRSYGAAEQQAIRLGELVTAWDAASRPGADRLRIDAYPSGFLLPGIEGSVHPALHTTFVVSRK
jgi:protein-L-isoaspartate(D-aspartate) O-methyltransferase